MTTLNLYCFGPHRIELDNHPLEVDLHKGLALLAYLAVTNQAHSRDALTQYAFLAGCGPESGQVFSASYPVGAQEGVGG